MILTTCSRHMWISNILTFGLRSSWNSKSERSKVTRPTSELSSRVQYWCIWPSILSPSSSFCWWQLWDSQCSPLVTSCSCSRDSKMLLKSSTRVLSNSSSRKVNLLRTSNLWKLCIRVAKDVPLIWRKWFCASSAFSSWKTIQNRTKNKMPTWLIWNSSACSLFWIPCQKACYW